MKREAYISIEDGDVLTKSTFKRFFDGLQDGRYLLSIESKNKRTLPQNRYYFGIVVPCIQAGLLDTGNEFSKEEVHDFLKARFNYKEVVNYDTGQIEKFPMSTSGLTKQEFSDYIERIQQFASEFLSVVIPDAGQQLKAEI
jgi:hypothetical protein